jgi:hypothetical protein
VIDGPPKQSESRVDGAFRLGQLFSRTASRPQEMMELSLEKS